MEVNYLVFFGSALIPLIIGALWYNPKVLGTAWMKESGLTEERLKGANMGLIFGVTYLFSLLLALILSTMVIHQNHMYSILLNEPGLQDPQSELGRYVADFMAKYGRNFRTFGHGAFHGATAGLLFALPVLGTNALFERKGFRYIAINAGYWTITMALMGGVLCAYL